MRTTILFAAGSFALLSACGDPLDRVEKLSDVDVVQTEPVVEALADPEDDTTASGLFGGLFRRVPVVTAEAPADATAPDSADIDAAVQIAAPTELPAQDTSLVEPADNAEAALGDELPVDSQTALTPAAVEPTLAEPEKRGGFIGALLRGSTRQAENAQGVVASVAEVSEKSADETQSASAPAVLTSEEVANESTADVQVAGGETAPDSLVEPTKRAGLLGGLFQRGDVSAAPEAPQAPVQTASLGPVAAPEAVPALVEPEKRGGLFGRRKAPAPRNGPDAADVSYGDVVPFGAIARVCEAKSRPLGRKIEKAGRGRGYALYDSNPGSTGQRTFYITGFSDGCPRQFTAALALFGAPSMHEQLRYGKPADQYPYSVTDKEYETVKSAICRVGKRKPCGDKIDALEKDTVFVSTYERFPTAGRWADILLHDGAVRAASLKKP